MAAARKKTAERTRAKKKPLVVKVLTDNGMMMKRKATSKRK
jgi:hypothetical protein